MIEFLNWTLDHWLYSLIVYALLVGAGQTLIITAARVKR